MNFSKKNHELIKTNKIEVSKKIKKTLGISLLLITLLISGQVQGQKRNSNGNRSIKTERSVNNNRNGSNNRIGNNHNRNDRYRTQPIRRNPNYRYSHHRRLVRTLPIHHRRIMHRGLPYFYYSGIYYTMYGDQYIVILPPRGFRITVLPVGHVRVVIGPSIYYYHSGVYYIENSTTSIIEGEGRYEVTKPPVGVVVSEISNDSEEVIIDGKVFYEYNEVLYIKEINFEGKTTYKVVYSKSNED